MQASKLFEGILSQQEIDRLGNVDFKRVVRDSSFVQKGDLYVCLTGIKQDGHLFADEALRKGAAAVVTSEDLGIKNQILVQDERSAYALLNKNFYQKACDKLKIIAITGTNGKTTVSHVTGQILESLGHKVGIIGTLGVFYDGKCEDGILTTPDPDVLHRVFKDMLNAGVEYVVMEASAHAIYLKKLDGIMFESAVLTNITQDHLDYFKTMDNYAAAKLSLFDKSHCKCAFFCNDDTTTQKLLKGKSLNIPVKSYGLTRPCDCFAVNPHMSINGSKFYVNCNDEIDFVNTKLFGTFNIDNILAAISVCAHERIRIEDIVDAIKNVQPIPGRMNVIKGADNNVIIDYAHTPDGLEKVLKTIKQVCDGRLICVFGCGGNRDKGKRKIMGQIASKYADKVILTSDNPRFEVPRDIIADIETGVSGDYEVQEDRRAAIALGLKECGRGDILLIAGKGAEVTQEIAGIKYHFSDTEEVYKMLSLRKVKIGEEND